MYRDLTAPNGRSPVESRGDRVIMGNGESNGGEGGEGYLGGSEPAAQRCGVSFGAAGSVERNEIPSERVNGRAERTGTGTFGEADSTYSGGPRGAHVEAAALGRRVARQNPREGGVGFPTMRVCRVVVAVGLLVTWILVGAGPRLADAVVPDAPRLPVPDVSGRMHVNTRATILAEATARQAQAVSDAAARKQVFAGAFTAIVLTVCLVMALGRSRQQLNPSE